MVEKAMARFDGGGGGGLCTLKVLLLHPASKIIAADSRVRIHRLVATANLLRVAKK